MSGRKKQAKKIPKSFFGRATKLIGTASVLIGREIASNISAKIQEQSAVKKVQVRVKQAQDLVESLSHLKGAAMKAGQLISLEMSDLLPQEVVDVLRTLHDTASFMPLKDVRKVLRAELGADRLNQIEDFSPEPIASASIGQVHRAKIGGEEVVLKVQYPGVAGSIETDVAMLKRIVNGMLAVQGRKISFDGVFEELVEGLKIEVDYRKEAEFLQLYTDAFAGLDAYVIPKVYPQFSTSRVLTMSYESGKRLNDWLKGELSQETKQRFAELVLNLLFYEFFSTGLVQTDPNYGNFLLRGDAEQLVILDFGAVRSYPLEFRHRVRGLLRAAMERDHAKIMELAQTFELLDPRESPEVREHFLELLDLVIFMFRPENQPFVYANDDYLKKIRETTLGFANKVKYTSPARQMIFLNRKLGGMYHLLKDANCSVNVDEFWQKVMALPLS